MLAFPPISVHMHGKNKFNVISKYSAGRTSTVKQHKIAIGFIIILNLKFMIVISCVKVTMRDTLINYFQKIVNNHLVFKKMYHSSKINFFDVFFINFKNLRILDLLSIHRLTLKALKLMFVDLLNKLNKLQPQCLYVPVLV